MHRVHSQFPRFLWLAISLLLIQHISAQHDSCDDDDFATVNATASVEIYAMHPQDPLNGSPYGVLRPLHRGERNHQYRIEQLSCQREVLAHC